MRRISKEARAIAEHGMPQFTQAVRQAALARKKIGKAAPVAITLDEFGGDFMLLYACLLFARSYGIPVLILSE